MQNASIEGFSDIVHRSADWRQGARQKTQNAGAEVPTLFRSSTTTAAPRTGSSRLKTHKIFATRHCRHRPLVAQCTSLPTLLCVLFCTVKLQSLSLYVCANIIAYLKTCCPVCHSPLPSLWYYYNNCNSAKLCKSLPCLCLCKFYCIFADLSANLAIFCCAKKQFPWRGC